MKVVIVGNGILGLTTAFRLVNRHKDVQIKIIGPSSNVGSASLAAAAMLNSFCEVDPGTLQNPILRQRFLLNRSAVPLWPEFIHQIRTLSKMEINHGFGTYLVHNHAADELDDSNFDAVLNALKEFSEPYEFLDPKQIPNFNPSPSLRAAKALLIPNEGWVNPVHLIDAIKRILHNSGRVEFVDAHVSHLKVDDSTVRAAVLQDESMIFGDRFLLAPGAVFSEIIDKSHLPIKLPRIFYGVGCSILLKTAPNTHSHCVRTPNRGLACGIYSAPFDAQHTIVGASNFISPEPEHYARITSVHTLLEAAMEQINSVFYRSLLVKVNVGWRPTSEDTLPLLGGCDVKNLVIATGTKRDGLHCSPKISIALSNLIMGEDAGEDWDLYRPQRDRQRIYSRDEAIHESVNHTINAAYQHGFKSAKNRMVEDLRKHYTREFSEIHDANKAFEWGIPPELLNMYKYGHIK